MSATDVGPADTQGLRPGDEFRPFSNNDAFGHWLAGFTDGEGCFDIRRSGGSWKCRFVIGLRIDDLPIVREIEKFLGTGKVGFVQARGNVQAQARYRVESQPGCARVVSVFECYPLRAKKAADFAVWKEAVALSLRNRYRRTQRDASFDECMAALAASLRGGRNVELGDLLPQIAVAPSPQLRLIAGGD